MSRSPTFAGQPTGFAQVGCLRRLLAVGFAVLHIAPCVQSLEASTTASTLKAAFLYNFVKFTDWPTDVLRPGQKLLLCVVGDSDVSDALEQTIKGRTIDTHEIVVQLMKTDSATLSSCHLLYVNGVDVKRSAVALAALRTQPIFTVSDGERFAQGSGIGELVTEDDHIRFSINVVAAERARLQISSKLLSLARIVKDQ